MNYFTALSRITKLLQWVWLGLAAVFAAEEPLLFSVTGDGPYGEEDWERIPLYFELEKQEPQSAFVIHLGDLNKGSMNPGEAYYLRVAEMYKACPIPMIFTIGDNEWNDHENPDFSRAIWNRLFLHFPDHFSHTLSIRRQPQHEENMVWISQQTLFIGVNLVGGRIHDEAEWRARHQDDADWVVQNLAAYQDQSAGAVIFAHAMPHKKHDDFFERMIPAVQAYRKPAMYIHGDGHTWQYEPRWRVENLLRVQVDQIAKAPFAQVRVDYSQTIPFQFNRRLNAAP